MIISIDAFCFDETKRIDYSKAIPIDIRAFDLDQCILVIPDVGELVVNRKQLANAVVSAI